MRMVRSHRAGQALSPAPALPYAVALKRVCKKVEIKGVTVLIESWSNPAGRSWVECWTPSASGNYRTMDGCWWRKADPHVRKIALARLAERRR